MRDTTEFDLIEADGELADGSLPYAFKFVDELTGEVELSISDGGSGFWEKHGDDVTIIGWGAVREGAGE